MLETIYENNSIKHTNYLIKINSKKDIKTATILNDVNFGTIEGNDNNLTFYYFNGNSDKIIIKVLSIDTVTITVTKEDIDIKQIYIAEHVKHFGDDIYPAHPNLSPYHNDYMPSFFYGMLSTNDLNVLTKNKSLKIIIWTGGDMRICKLKWKKTRKSIRKNIMRIKRMKNVVHIAVSKFIEDNLNILGIKYIRAPFMGFQFDKYKPVAKGKCIYVYTTPLGEEKYGRSLYNQVIEKYKHINFIFTCSQGNYIGMLNKNLPNPHNIKYYTKKELIEKIYPQCFIGLRLTVHDALAATVQELGAMGIKSIHNGDSPSCLNYENIEDIFTHIDNEIKTIGTTDYELSSNVKKYLKLDKDFFNTKYYTNHLNL
ncbi:hypothetical protein QJ857_gp0887 [Tupanvirus soda lake]|uniref:Uncharacterized protein n=2 Tax=Tupanvirus TaxID=2094720 RepID=A0A6N1NKQ0_9VIRU|nr:hypothetical protein QJ857_gp0887 [Tupanvirus soda lake]QKU35165.1 hypothetical protein [Tupanvirus soda lake]